MKTMFGGAPGWRSALIPENKASGATAPVARNCRREMVIVIERFWFAVPGLRDLVLKRLRKRNPAGVNGQEICRRFQLTGQADNPAWRSFIIENSAAGSRPHRAAVYS